jgi:hypothetical protein
MNSTPNANFRRDEIPLWINGISILVAAILTFQSISAYVNPSWAYGLFDNTTLANQQVMTVLGGRNVVMLLLTLLALRSQNAMFLTYTFIMHLIREAQDMFIVPYFEGFTTIKGIGIFLTFLLVFVIPYLFAIKKLRTLAAK